MLPSATEVEYFLEVYQTRHISKAAIRLGVTQPTLTVSLKKLEDKLGVILFHRSKQGVVPTSQGSAFYQKANVLMEHWKDVHQGLNESVTEIQGRFKIGCHPSVGGYTLPTFVANLQITAPKIQIELQHDFSRKLTEKIISYELDLGFVVNPSRHPDLVLKKMGSDRVALWKKRGLKASFNTIFADMNLHQVEDTLGKEQFKKFRSWNLISSSSLELIRTLILSGRGAGFLPERVAKADGADLVLFDPELPVYQDQIYLVYRREALSSKAGKALLHAASFELP